MDCYVRVSFIEHTTRNLSANLIFDIIIADNSAFVKLPCQHSQDKKLYKYLKKLYIIDDLPVWGVSMRFKTAIRTTPIELSAHIW